jgi:hypothetical protein
MNTRRKPETITGHLAYYLTGKGGGGGGGQEEDIQNSTIC